MSASCIFTAGIAALVSIAGATSARAAMIGSWGVDLTDQDRSVRPGDNFAMYQNGGWFRRTELKPGQSVSAYWRDVRVAGTTRIDEMMASLDAAPPAKKDRIEELVSAFHRSARQEVVDARGLQPLQPLLTAISAVRDKRQFAELAGAAEGPGEVRPISARLIPGRNPYHVNIVQDQQDPARYAIYITQGGLILPGPEYYTDPSFKDLKAAYESAVITMLRRIGWADPERHAQQIVDLETEIAKVSLTHAQQRDTAGTYQRISLAGLKRQAPGFDWTAFFKGAGLPSDALIAVDSPATAGKIAAIYAAAPLDVLKAKEAFGTLLVDAVRLDSTTYGIYKQFADSVLPGILASPTRQLDITNLIEDSIQDAISAAFVKRYFSPAVKTKAQVMAELMREALDRRVSNSDWLSPEGQRLAHQKVAGMRISVGYPDKLDDYRGLVIKGDDLFGNAARAAIYAWRKQVARLRQPVDRSQWVLTPFYAQIPAYTPATNSLIVPAAMLTPPFFDINADDAVNYGAVGTIIGSQIAAALVGNGIEYDASGRLGKWLPAADRARFDRARDKISALYSREQPLPGMHLKGELLVGESLTDILGIEIALDAYRASATGAASSLLDGYTGEQRFFLGRAQSWRAKFSETALRNQIATGSNTPPYFRLNGPLPNVDEWYEAFGVKSGDKLYLPPSERVHL
jgi:putative endopeptidase